MTTIIIMTTITIKQGNEFYGHFIDDKQHGEHVCKVMTTTIMTTTTTTTDHRSLARDWTEELRDQDRTLRTRKVRQVVRIK